MEEKNKPYKGSDIPTIISKYTFANHVDVYLTSFSPKTVRR